LANEVVLLSLPAEDKKQKFVRLHLEILITIGGGRLGGVWFYVQIGFLPISPGESFKIMIEDWRKGVKGPHKGAREGGNGCNSAYKAPRS